jgi:hypothetical protein
MAIWQVSRLMNRYYDKVGMAAAGIANCPRFVSFKAGFGLISEVDPNTPVLQAIPPDMEDVPGFFYEGLCAVSYANGITTCKCEIPQGAVSAPVRMNVVGVFDQDGELVATCVMLPDWVTPNETYRAYPQLIFPVEQING